MTKITIGEALIADAEEKQNTRFSCEFAINERVWVRSLKKAGKILETPTYSNLNFIVQLDDADKSIQVNWFDLFFEQEKDKYNFKPLEEKKKENVSEKVFDLSAL